MASSTFREIEIIENELKSLSAKEINLRLHNYERRRATRQMEGTPKPYLEKLEYLVILDMQRKH